MIVECLPKMLHFRRQWIIPSDPNTPHLLKKMAEMVTGLTQPRGSNNFATVERVDLFVATQFGISDRRYRNPSLARSQTIPSILTGSSFMKYFQLGRSLLSQGIFLANSGWLETDLRSLNPPALNN